MAFFRVIREYTALVMKILHTSCSIFMTRAVYSRITLKAIQYYIIISLRIIQYKNKISIIFNDHQNTLHIKITVQVHKNKFFLYGEALLSKSIISLSYVQYFEVAIIIVCTKQIHGHTESSTNMHFVLNQKQTLS